MRAFAVAFGFLLVAGAGCSDKPKPKPDAGDGGMTDADTRQDIPVDRTDAEVKVDIVMCPPATNKLAGDSCTCASECASGFCADGVCCTTACTEGCKSCAVAGSMGTCVNLTVGATPRTAAACPASPASSCGLDGKCDGAGACRRHVAGTVCRAGSCENDAVVGAFVCTEDGQCKPGPTEICAPFSCDTAKRECFSICYMNSQCVSGHACQNGTCGKKMKGARCELDDECASGFCADKVCCNVGCKGACVKCNLPTREGTCFPIAGGVPDPRGICTDQGASSCGRTGTCDGVAGCAKYPRDTLCEAPSCSGNRLNTARTCDGLGTCRTANLTSCSPFRCANGACTDSCQSDGDCDIGKVCQNNTCGLKKLGQACMAPAECETNYCVDGVCCASTCTGACRSCALPSSPGMCVAIAVGNADTRGVCKDDGAAACGNNGKCDGTGGCATYPAGTPCKDESCSSNVYTPTSTCNASKQCVAPESLPCRPYVCNGNKCFNACTTNTQCLPPNSCANNSCGLAAPGASCQTGDQCENGLCQQGVCCRTTCTGPCRDCSLSGSLGTCSPVMSGSDPAGMCQDQGSNSCGTNGKCESGACQRYAMGTACANPTCPAGTSTSTATSTCDGAGTCVTPAATSCFPFLCGTGACKSSCTADADCAAPAVCINGTCGRKPNGLPCANDNNECSSAFCVQGVCCGSACTERCKSCALLGSMGTCTNVASGDADPKNTCMDMGPTSCSTDGFCDGNGGCRLYDAATSCAAPTCPTGQSTATSGRICDGRGVCQPATTLPCAPYVCDGATACRGACTSDGDCLPPAICDPLTNLCGNRRRLGQSCAATADCLTGASCVDGVCCSANSCPTCQACNVAGSAGNCTNVLLDTAEPHGLCSPSPPCGNTGACNGAGACQVAGTSVACGTASCSGSTYTPISHCSGSGGCAAPTSTSCGAYVCGAGVCKTTCTVDGDCVAPTTCQSGNCALKANGVACTGGAQCISGFCTDGVCCGTAGCPLCQACNVNGAGSCANLASGQAAPNNGCPPSAPCGNTGACNGAGACQQASTAVMCGTASCTGSTFLPVSNCDGAGTCAPPTTSTCFPYLCGGAACRTNCNADTDCISATSYYCTGTGGTCMPKKSNGMPCSSANQCGSGFCTDGVCCGVGACPTCQACNVGATPGSCANVPSGTADSSCAANPPCGNTGVCNGAGACTQASTSVACGIPSCTGSTFTPVSSCNGSGGCATPTNTSCSPYVCGTNSCRTTCNTNVDCINTSYYCTGTGGSCLVKQPTGTLCVTANQCASGFCTDGTCCGVSACPTCQACNVGGSEGSCANRASGSADTGCVPNPPCGNTGQCNGAGACSQGDISVPCGSTTCTGSTLSPISHCNGTGSCAPPTPSSCLPYVCGTNACKTSCNTNADCISTTSYYCTGAGGPCMPKKANGMTCGTANECASGFCTDGVCCGVGACPSCQACNLSGNGTCSNVSAGTNDGSCTPNPPCGNTGTCNGAGACTQAVASVPCGSASCTGTTYTPVSNCTGSGSCATPTTQSCVPFVCGATSCKTTCANNSDCSGTSYYCTAPGGSCLPKKANGDPCGSANECASGFCTDGVCCGVGACPTCQSCNVGANAGSCANVAAGMTDTGCGASPPCGNTGTCNGAGACTQAASSVQCGSASCSGTTYTPPAFCSGNGSCSNPGTQSCAPYVCGSGACRVDCLSDGDCTSGNYCTGSGGSCVPKKGPGASCMAGNECGTGNCVDGVCCSSPSCPTCQSCSVGNGTCGNVASGSPEPHTRCTANPPCGNTGACDGGGACQLASTSVMCGSGSCTGSTQTLPAFCSGSGSCSSAMTQSCAPYVCGTTTCRNNCSSDGDCSAGNYCLGTACVAKKANGVGCGMGNECTSNYCVDSVCCSSSVCGTCQACNLTGNGTCTAVSNGTAEPHNLCPASPPCGNTGSCVSGACQQALDTMMCATAFCSGSVFHPNRFCSGSGSCDVGSTPDCSPYPCTMGGCLSTCNGDGDCASGYFCTAAMNGMCQPKRANGQTCTGTNQCTSGNCTEGYCCSSSACPMCQSCAVDMLQGTCTNVPAGGGDPTGTCTAQGPAGCQRNGTCDGMMGCALYDAFTVCATSCSGDATTLFYTFCDGAGTCGPGTSQLTCPDPTVCMAGSPAMCQ